MKTIFNDLFFVFFALLTLVACDREESASPSLPKSEKLSSPAASPELLQSQPESQKSTSLSSDPDQLNLRAPKQRHPEIVTQPEQPNPIRDKLNEAITGANGNIAKLSENFTGLWNDGISRLPDKPLLSSEAADIGNGTRLPKEIEMLSQHGTGEDTAEQLIRGVALWSALMHNDLLTQFASQRANTLPPKTADVVVYEALVTGIQEFSQTRGQSSYASFEKWEPFANVPNPIYRLLALKAASTAASIPAWNVDVDSKEFNRINEQPKLEFYLSYLDEKDAIILAEAIRSLARVPLPEARQAIENFHAQQLQKGDTVLIQAAEEALRTQKLISP